MSTLKSFAAAITPIATTGSTLSFHLNDDWLQGRSSFGGLQAAIALRTMRTLVPPALPLRVLQTTFVGPVPGGEAVVTAKLLRAGKNVTHVEARIEVEGATACLVVGVFGAARQSSLAIAAPAAEPPRGPDGLPDFPFLSGLTPSFTRHFVMRWGQGGYPFSGAKEADTRIWLQHRSASGDAESDLVALTDVVPSPTISLLKNPAPASSLTWTLELLEPAVAQGEGFWRIDSEVHAAKDGYVAQTARVHTPDNRLVALSRQTVVVFA